MSNVVPFPGSTILDLDPDEVLKAAHGLLDTVVILGYDKQGDLVMASSTGKKPEILWLLEVLKSELMKDRG